MIDEREREREILSSTFSEHAAMDLKFSHVQLFHIDHATR